LPLKRMNKEKKKICPVSFRLALERLSMEERQREHLDTYSSPSPFTDDHLETRPALAMR
jgi:hypothetical protein